MAPGAVWSFVCSILCVVCTFVGLIVVKECGVGTFIIIAIPTLVVVVSLAIAAIKCGNTAIKTIRQRPDEFIGSGIAIAGIIVTCLWMGFLILSLVHLFNRPHVAGTW